MGTLRPPLRIATRASPLALWQAEHVAALLRAAVPDATVELVHVTTSGDRDLAGALRSFGGLGVFTREVQKAVLDGQADIAVHSLKDLPTESAPGLCLAAVPEREDTADALVLPLPLREGRGEGQPLHPGCSAAAGVLAMLPDAAHLGTGSLRRRAQLLNVRSDLRLSDVRGNVQTRLGKLDAGEYDALVLAVAGLKRLGLAGRISLELRPPLMLPAVGQGALAIECRDADAQLRSLLARIDDAPTRARVTAERTLLAHLRAGCHAPVGAATLIEGSALVLEGVVLNTDGKERLFATSRGDPAQPAALGLEVGEALLTQGAARLLTRS